MKCKTIKEEDKKTTPIEEALERIELLEYELKYLLGRVETLEKKAEIGSRKDLVYSVFDCRYPYLREKYRSFKKVFYNSF